MATNKRKDTAALFELLDKSTLKVPKNASSLKIPNWWSSKTNPATTPESPPPQPQSSAPAEPAAAVAVVAVPQVAAVAIPPEPSEPPTPPAQSRLFDPPPSNVTPSTSPSIRPPTATLTPIAPHKNTPVAPLQVSPVAAASPEPMARIPHPFSPPPSTASAPPATPPTAKPPAAKAPAPPLVPPTKLFAPQTHAQERKPWSSPRPGAFARIPGWVMLSGVAGLILLVVLIIFLAKNLGKAPAPVTRNPPPSTASVNFGPGVPTLPTTTTAAVGYVYDPRMVPYNPQLYYVFVNQIKERDAAYKEARFLADHKIDNRPVDVAVETIQVGDDIWYALVAIRGFSTAAAVKEYRRDIVRIGDTLKPGIWKNAYARQQLTNNTQPAAGATTRSPK